jgi:hypothetical protein
MRGTALDGAESKDPGDADYPCRSELFDHRSLSFARFQPSLKGPDVILAWCRFKRGILSESRQGRLNLAQDEILGFRTRPDQSREGRLKIAGALSVLRLEEFRHRV